MPVVHKKSDEIFSIAIWESTEELSALSEIARLGNEESQSLDSFKSQARKREFLSVRVLLRELFPHSTPKIFYDENGKPHLSNGSSISISHTGIFVAIMVCRSAHCGIDLETISERILLLGKKFVGEKEVLPDHHTIEHLHVIWGAKEVIFKIHSRGDLDFRKHLLTHPFQYNAEGSLNASLTKEGFENDFTIFYECLGKLMLAWSFCD